MRRTLDPSDLALEASGAAAAKAGIELRLLESIDDFRAVCSLFGEVWETAGDEAHLPPDVLRAQVYSGNYAAGAFAGGELVGGLVGFLGRDDSEVYLHSHILGVEAGRRGGSIGFALKQHQRAWALNAGLRKMTWTFDPLVRRNAHFNLQKLGADASVYLENFYGPMTDGINAGDESDRLLIEWSLDAPRVERAAGGLASEPDVMALIDAGATVALSEEADVIAAAHRSPILLCATPDDIVALRRADPALASRWRRALRATLGEAIRDGYEVSGFSRSGWYVLEAGGRRVSRA
jgi:predicted GNAT superfamily acetyltransferase